MKMINTEKDRLGASVGKKLADAICDYISWMMSNGYVYSTIESFFDPLNNFLFFICRKKIAWDNIFTSQTLDAFQEEIKGKHELRAIKGLAQFLFKEKRIPPPFQANDRLPNVYKKYLAYYQKRLQAPIRRVNHIRGVLAAFHKFLEKSKTSLPALTIDQIDAFFMDFNSGYQPSTRRTYFYFIKGFLSYLYHERKIIKKDLALLITVFHTYSQSKPPKFLRLHEVQRMFDCVDLSTQLDIRTYAIFHLAYFLGLRLKEISLITLDDISFENGEISVEDRKSGNPIVLPLPEDTIKAIATYIIGVRPKSRHRHLFLTLFAPYKPMASNTVSIHLIDLIKKANLPANTYSLRHTYAQNLIESGASIYEIKEMMGHESLRSTQQYLSIDINLMRKVLFNESI